METGPLLLRVWVGEGVGGGLGVGGEWGEWVRVCAINDQFGGGGLCGGAGVDIDTCFLRL